ncbi:MAG: TraR/DksA family transcriptional regulator [Flavisolibacter sp.]|jgi:RNA polymerase-binding transcription factor DksA|nr:TraR/DksA family transcriptional regulator [Flavisolibacter sp.]
MATKKLAPKKAARPVQKAPVKPAAKGKGKPVASKKAAPAPKKAVAVKKGTPAKTPAKKAAAKAPVKTTKSQPAKAVAKSTPKTPHKSMPATKKQEIKNTAPEPAKKPVVAAATQQTAKTATKPLESKPAPKEPAKPAKVVIPKTSTDKKIKYEPDFTRSVLDAQKGVESTHTMRYSDGDLGEFRDLINKKLEVAKKELAYLQSLITRKDESGDLDEGRYMTMEDGSMSMEREQLSQMASRQIQFIDHLEKAIMRIENKTYGICRVTGKLIDKARLRAVPHATLSIEAKQMMNK